MVLETGICILAGGLSTRMGKDKGRLRLARRTLLGHIRRTAESVTPRVRVIRKDIVPRCGPMGGIYTGLKTSRNAAELFLSCDMPFVRPALLKKLIAMRPPVFVLSGRPVGFPILLSMAQLEMIEAEIAADRLSLQSLALRLKARTTPAPVRQLFNVNTRVDWAEAQRRIAELPL